MNIQIDRPNEKQAATEQLENAFELFNQFSEKLAASYSDLESQVARLTKELAQARSERLIHLTEKELLATRLEGLLDALPAGIVVLDDNERITQTNPVARLMLAGDKDNSQLLGKKWQKIAQRCIKTEANELRLLDGRWINLSVCPLTIDNTGLNKGKIILISDITENRKLQIKLNHQQRLTSLGEMVASLAHQIRTPLSSALLYISTINHPINTQQDRVRFADKTKERLHHLERMVNDMLMFARGDVSEAEYINASKIMLQLKNTTEAHSDHNGRPEKIQFHIDRNVQNTKIKANQDALQSALQNIIDNAVEACVSTKKQAVIKVNAFLNANNQLEISVADNGCGMSETRKQKVLQPFFTTRASGTGLGLAVVNATVSRFGGEMVISSKQGVGSKFIVKFPCSEAAGILPSNLSRTQSNARSKIINIFNDATTGSNEIKKQEVAL